LSGYGSLVDAGAELAEWLQLANGFDAGGRPVENRVSLAHALLHANAHLAVAPGMVLDVDVSGFGGTTTPRDRSEVGSEVIWLHRRFGDLGAEGNATFRWSLRRDLTLLLGTELVYDAEREPSLTHVAKAPLEGTAPNEAIEGDPPQAIARFVNPAVYGQVQWEAIPNLLDLTAGVRYDYHNIYGNQVSGRFAAVSSPLNGLYFKVLYGSAFKAPSAQLLYAVPLRANDIIGNPNLKAQYVHTGEAQGSYRYRFLQVSSDVSVSYLTNLAEFTTRGVNRVARNLTAALSASWETELSAWYGDWLRGYASASVVGLVRESSDSAFVTSLVGTSNVGYPPLVVRTGAVGRLPWINARVAADLRYVSVRRANVDNILAAGESYDLPDYFWLDLACHFGPYEVLKDRETTISLLGKNLLGASGPEPGYAGIDYPLLQRMLLLQLRQTF
jgi:iron complex outermembrane receptor protein